MDICALGAARVANDNGQFGLPRASLLRIVEDDGSNSGRGEDLGEMPISCALGVMALPAPADAKGHAEGVFDTNVGGFPAAVVAAWDARCVDVAGQLSAGDTAVHGTHSDATKRAVLFCKENAAAVIVGNDLVLSLDRGQKAVTLAAFGHVLQVSDSGGILIAEKSGGNWIELKGGNNSIVGPTVIGGPTAVPIQLLPPTLLTAWAAVATASATAIAASATEPAAATLGTALATLCTAIASAVSLQTKAT
jgi:hypothetical protein